LSELEKAWFFGTIFARICDLALKCVSIASKGFFGMATSYGIVSFASI